MFEHAIRPCELLISEGSPWLWDSWYIFLWPHLKRTRVLGKMFLGLGCDNLEVKENSMWFLFTHKLWLNIVGPEGQKVAALSRLGSESGLLGWCRHHQALPAGGALLSCDKKGIEVYIMCAAWSQGGKTDYKTKTDMIWNRVYDRSRESFLKSFSVHIVIIFAFGCDRLLPQVG